MSRLLDMWRVLAFANAEEHFDGCLKDAVQDMLLGVATLLALVAMAALVAAGWPS